MDRDLEWFPAFAHSLSPGGHSWAGPSSMIAQVFRFPFFVGGDGETRPKERTTRVASDDY